MSHHHDGGPYEDVDYDSEASDEQGYAQHEAYVPEEVPNPTYTTPTVGRKQPALISNRDLMEQMYHMRNALKQGWELLNVLVGEPVIVRGRRSVREDKCSGDPQSIQ